MKYVLPNELIPGRVPISGCVFPVLTRRRTNILIRTPIRFFARKSSSISHPSHSRSSRFLSVSHLATGRDRLLFSSSETRSRTRPSQIYLQARGFGDTAFEFRVVSRFRCVTSRQCLSKSTAESKFLDILFLPSMILLPRKIFLACSLSCLCC